MKNIQLLAFVLTLLATATAHAQGFRHFYDIDHIYSMPALANTPDGGYVFSAFTSSEFQTGYLIRTDAQGDTLWARAYPMPKTDNPKAAKVFVLPNGNFALCVYPVITGYTTTMLFDSAGVLLNSRTFLGKSPLSPVGNEFFLLQPNWDSTYNVIRLAADMSTLWEKKVQPAPVSKQPDKSIMDMTTTNDAGFCLLINFDSTAQFPQTPRLIKFDLNGDIQWEHGYGLTNYVYGGNLKQAPNGDFIFDNQGNGTVLLRTDEQGNLLWNTKIMQANGTIALLQDGGIALLGSDLNLPWPWRLTRVDAAGNELFSKNIPIGNSVTIGYGLTTTPDGGLMICSTYGFPVRGMLAKTDANGKIYDVTVQGKVYFDRNHDCLQSPLDITLAGWLVTATNGAATESAITDTSGFYELSMPLGDFSLQIHPISAIWKPCDNGIYTFTSSAPDTIEQDFLVQDSALCSLLDVALGTNALRRCQVTTYEVAWSNKGTFFAENASIAVILPPEINFISASKPLASQAGDTLWFDLGTVDVNQRGKFWIRGYVDCDSTQLGQTLCTKVHIFPDTLCARPGGWSGARVVADSRCLGDTLVEFSLKNIGDAPTQTLDYIITEDHVVLNSGNFNLNPGEARLMLRPANGTTQRIEAEQEPGYPFSSLPSAAREGCGGWNSLRLINQFPLDDAEPFTDIDCREIIGSYDPNDKQGLPLGYGAEHLIEPGTELTYLIRFQNTGTDTAFLIEVRDTLSPWLDPTTVQTGAASHDFTWNMRGGNALSFRFENILLPDSNVNEPGSHGFIQFRVKPKNNAPLGTLIENSASIYFDFNAPVLTNTTTHQLGHDFYTVLILDLPDHKTGIPVQVYPNPFRDRTHLILSAAAEGIYQFKLFDTAGRLVHTQELHGVQMEFFSEGLRDGCYWFELLDTAGGLKACGKILKY